MHKRGIAPLTLGLIIVALVGFVFISVISYSYLSSTESEDTPLNNTTSTPSRVIPLPTPNNSRGGAFTGGGSSSSGSSSSGGSGSGSSSSGSSGGPAPQCSNGIDDDSDGFIDYPADTGCSDASDTDESGFGTGSNLPPSALFTLTPSSGSVPLSVTFNGSLSSDPEGLPLNYSWWWTNGTATLTSTLNTSFSYVFTQAGTFTVNLTVTDNAGASSSNQTFLVVSAVCGDGIIHQGEQCDGSNLGGNTCPTAFPSAGYTGGTLSCSASCQFVSTGCTSTAPDTTPPQFSNLIVTPNAYTFGQATVVNVTVTDNIAVSSVNLTFNGQVYLNPTKNGNIYSQNVGQRAAGTYSYSWSANDTSNNRNTTTTQSYVLAQATPSLTVQSSSGSSFGYGTATTITVSGCPTSGAGGVTCRLYRNSVDVTSTIGQAVTLGAGAYTFTYNATGGQNYTSASQSVGVTVSRAASSVSLAITPSNSVLQGTQTTATGTCQSGLTCTLTRNGVSATSPDVQTLAVGSYVYNYSTNGNTNYSASSQTQTLTVSSVPVFTLTVAKSGAGGGLVTSNVSGINCGSVCSNNTIPQGNSILLTATPNASSTFAGWSGAGCSGTGTCQVTMSASQSVTAQFNVVGAPLSIAFVAPTPSNGASQSAQSFTINASSTSSGQHYAFLDFNNDVAIWMRMDDLDGSSNPVDLSSYASSSVRQGTASQSLSGAFGRSFNFDGSTGAVMVANPAGLANAGGSSFTVSAWVNPSNAAGSWQAILEYGRSGLSWFGLWKSANGQFFHYRIGNRGTDASTFSIVNGQWYHIVETFNADTNLTSFYVNGAPVDSTTLVGLTWAPAAGALGIGGRSDAGGENFAGSVDEVLLIKRELSAQEVRALYNAGASNSQLASSFTSVPFGAYSYQAHAVGLTANRADTETRSLTLQSAPDFTNPTSSLASPTNGASVLASSVSFSASVSDNQALRNATLFVWNAGTSAIVAQQTQSVSGTSASASFSGISLPSTGSYRWNVQATDLSNNRAFALVNFSFTYTPTYVLTVTKSGTGGGTVTSNIGGINCGSVCSNSTLLLNQVVVLTATPDATSNFTGWSGAGCSGTGTCQVTMSASQSVTAGFVSNLVATGWTDFAPSADSRIIYVSSSAGNDFNNGLSEATPKATIRGGTSLLRDGYPDHLRLKRGDVWHESLRDYTNNRNWRYSGRSPTEPLVVEAYGSDSDSRPMLYTDNDGAITREGNIHDVAFMNLELAPDPVTGTNRNGIGLTGPVNNLLFEDLLVRGYSNAFTLQENAATEWLYNITIRRCIIVDSYQNGGPGSRGQGILAGHTVNLHIIENVFDHNGWPYDDTQRSTEAHNMYLSSNNPGMVVSDNVVMRGGLLGISHNTPSAIITGNLLIGNVMAIGARPEGPGETLVADNVITEIVSRTDQLPGNPSPFDPKGIDSRKNWLGTGSGDVSGQIVMRNNLLFNGGSVHDHAGFDYNSNVPAISTSTRYFVNNTVYNWGGEAVTVRDSGDPAIFQGNTFVNTINSEALINFAPGSASGFTFSGNKYYRPDANGQWFSGSAARTAAQFISFTGDGSASTSLPSFPDSTRTVGTYMSRVMIDSGTTSQFIARVRAQRRGNWDDRLTALSVNSWLRAGFGMGSGGGLIGGSTECSDGIDNDGDGSFDLKDPNCADSQDNSESGTVYYVSDCGAGADPNCVAGNDANAGTSPTAPVRTFDRARALFVSMQAGDAVAFAKGSSYAITSSNTWINGNCLSVNRCVVASYTPPWASGDEGKPYLSFQNGGHGFNLADGGSPEHEEGYYFRGLSLHSTSQAGAGFFIYNDVDNVTIDDMIIDNFNIGVNPGGFNGDGGPSTFYSEGTVLKNSVITNNAAQGWLGSGKAIEHNYFANNGYERGYGLAGLNHNIYAVAGDYAPTSNMRIVGNELYQSSMIDGLCRGVSLVAHGHLYNLTIEGNYVHEDAGTAAPGCYGISADNGGYSHYFPNLAIRGNRVENFGGTAMGCEGCEDAVIENNIIVSTDGSSVDGISMPSKHEDASRVRIANNDIYLTGDGSRGIQFYPLDASSTGFSVANNIIQFAGSGSFECMVIPDTTRLTAVDNNICYHPNAPGATYVRGYASLAAWRAASGFSAHDSEVNPLFVNAPSDFALLTGSPAIDAGNVPLAAKTDFNGAIRDSQPDIGAYEYNALLSSSLGRGDSAGGEQSLLNRLISFFKNLLTGFFVSDKSITGNVVKDAFFNITEDNRVHF